MMQQGEPKTVILTGGTSGIGMETLHALCRHNYDVIIGSRDVKKGHEVVEKVRGAVPAGTITMFQLDLTSTASIDQFVENFHGTGKKLDRLVLCAGMAPNFRDTKNRQMTPEGFEMAVATNHLGHFYLTQLLMNDLKSRATETGDVRVTVVTSSLHDPSKTKERMKRTEGEAEKEGEEKKEKEKEKEEPFSVQNLMSTKPGTYSGIKAYATSKACNVMFSLKLARDLEGSGVTVNSVCPGFIPATNLGRNAPLVLRFVMSAVVRPILWLGGVTRTVQQGASDLVKLIHDPSSRGLSGKFIREGVEDEPADFAKDEALQNQLWQVSGGLLHLPGFEPLEPGDLERLSV